MAPEVGAKQLATVRSDVYSLGATLYHLLAGDWMNPALRPITDWDQLNAAVAAHGQPRPLGEVAPHVPVGLRAIVMKAIDPDPAKRYQTPDELAAALGARSRPTRTWTRDQPCAGHTTCFAGTKSGASTFKVCAVPTGRRLSPCR
jgi:serine/threonine protein kinase